jgi:hypothetical protein
MYVDRIQCLIYYQRQMINTNDGCQILEMKSLSYVKWHTSAAQEPRAKPFVGVSVLHQPVLSAQDRADITASILRSKEHVAERMAQREATND